MIEYDRQYIHEGGLYKINELFESNSSTKSIYFVGALNQLIYIIDDLQISVFDENGSLVCEKTQEEHIKKCYPCQILNAIFLQCNNNEVFAFLLSTNSLHKIPLTLENLNSMFFCYWSNDVFDALFYVTGNLLTLVGLESQEFVQAIINSDAAYLTSKLRYASIQPCDATIVSIQRFDRTMAACFHFDNSSSINIFANGQAKFISSQNIVIFQQPTQFSILKCEFVGTSYLLALTNKCDLLLYNIAAGICCGPLVNDHTSTDFAIFMKPNRQKSDLFPEFTLYLIQTINESNVLNIISFPCRKLLFSIELTGEVSLCSRQSYVEDLPTQLEPLLIEHNSTTKVSTFKTVDLICRLEALIKEKKFADARHFAEDFNLDKSPISVPEFVNCLEELSSVVANIVSASLEDEDSVTKALLPDCCLISARAIEVLSEIKSLEFHEHVVHLAISSLIPSLDNQMQLLDNMVEKFPDFHEGSKQILVILKRLKTFRLLPKYRSLKLSSWIKFLSVNCTEEFTACFFSNLYTDLSDAFLLWRMYKPELVPLVRVASANTILDNLAKRPLTAGPSKQEQTALLESEKALHLWLQLEFLPVVISKCPEILPMIVIWLMERVKLLEKHSSLGLLPTGTHSPFEWPSSAISWVTDFINAIPDPEHYHQQQDDNHNSMTRYLTPGEEVDLYLAGLCSRSHGIDPLADLRSLLFDLNTVFVLHTEYNFKLPLAHCQNADSEELACKVLDFVLSCHDDTAAYALVSKFISDRKIGADKVYFEYCLSVLPGCKDAAKTCRLNTTSVALESLKGPAQTEVVRRACLVASWLESIGYKCKVASFLAHASPEPWSSKLHNLVDAVLTSCQRLKTHSLVRLLKISNRVKANQVLSRYEVQSDRVDIRSILLHAPPPWLTLPPRLLINNTSATTIKTRKEVHADALLVTLKLAPVNTPIADVLQTFAWRHLTMALQQALTIPVTEDEVQQRIDYSIEVICELEQLIALHNTESLSKHGGTSVFIGREWLYKVCFDWFSSQWHIVRQDVNGFPLYLRLVSCLAISALASNSSFTEASDFLRYAQCVQKLLTLTQELECSDPVFIFSAISPQRSSLDMDAGIEKAKCIFANIFRNCSDVPFHRNRIVVFKHLVGWLCPFDNTVSFDEVVEFNLFRMWVESNENLAMEALASGLQDFVTRLRLCSDQLQADVSWRQENVRRLLFDLIFPKVRQNLDVNAVCLKKLCSVIHDIQTLLVMLVEFIDVASSFSTKLQFVLRILFAFEVLYTKLARTLSKSGRSVESVYEGPFVNWNFSLLYDEEVPCENVVNAATSLVPISLEWIRELLWVVTKPLTLSTRGLDTNDTMNTNTEFSEIIVNGLELVSVCIQQMCLTNSVGLPLLFAIASLSLCTQRQDGIFLFASEECNEAQFLPMLTDQVPKALCSSLYRIFSSRHLDHPLAFGLALSMPFQMTSSCLRQIIATNPRASNKIKAITSMIYRACDLFPSENSRQLIEMSRSLSKAASWDSTLAAYGLRLSRRDPRADIVLERLIAIVPTTTEKLKPVPSLFEILEFCADFRLPVWNTLLQRLTALLQRESGAVSDSEQKQDTFGSVSCDVASVVRLNDEDEGEIISSRDDSYTSISINDNAVGRQNTYLECMHQKLSLAGAIMQELMHRVNRDIDDDQCRVSQLCDSLRVLFSETVAYDYEQLRFILTNLASLSSQEFDRQNIILDFLEKYERCSKVSAKEKSFWNKSDLPIGDRGNDYPLSAVRLPFHQLCSSEAMTIIGPELKFDTIHRWLKLNSLTELDLADEMRLKMMVNAFQPFIQAGFIKTVNVARSDSDNFFPYTTSALRHSKDWDQAFACELFLGNLFEKVYHLLVGVNDPIQALTCLADVFLRLRDGPPKLAFLKLAIRLALTWLGHNDEGVSEMDVSMQHHSFTANVREHKAKKQVYWTKRALKSARMTLKRLEIEVCLHKHRITSFWPDALSHVPTSTALIEFLLQQVSHIMGSFPGPQSNTQTDKMKTNQQNSIGGGCTTYQCQPLLNRLQAALIDLLRLQSVDQMVWARQLVWKRLRLPRSIVEAWDDGEANVDLDSTAISFDLDNSVLSSSIEAGGGDISLNMTMAIPQEDYMASGSPNTQVQPRCEPTADDFSLSEFLLVTLNNHQTTEKHANLATLLLNWALAPTLVSLSSLTPRELQKRWRAARLAFRSLPPLELPADGRRQLIKLASVARLGGNPDTLFISTSSVDLLNQLTHSKSLNQPGLIIDLVVDNDIVNVQQLDTALAYVLRTGAPMQVLRLVDYLLSSNLGTSVPWKNNEETKCWPELWTHHRFEPELILSVLARRMRNRPQIKPALAGQILTCLLAWPTPNMASALSTFDDTTSLHIKTLFAKVKLLFQNTLLSRKQQITDNKENISPDASTEKIKATSECYLASAFFENRS